MNPFYVLAAFCGVMGYLTSNKKSLTPKPKASNVPTDDARTVPIEEPKADESGQEISDIVDSGGTDNNDTV